MAYFDKGSYRADLELCVLSLDPRTGVAAQASPALRAALPTTHCHRCCGHEEEETQRAYVICPRVRRRRTRSEHV